MDCLTAHVTGVERKAGTSIVTVNISDEFGQSGKVQVKTWGANKKTKECKIQIENPKRHPQVKSLLL